jgi:hypothetical protein
MTAIIIRMAAALLLAPLVYSQNDNDCGAGGLRAGRNCAQLFECHAISEMNWKANLAQRWFFDAGDFHNRSLIVQNNTNPGQVKVLISGESEYT